jgi:hypothetical protein
LMKVCGQNYYFYAKTQTILTWQLQKRGWQNLFDVL